MLGAVACTCNPATIEAKFWNNVGSIPFGGNSPSIVDRVTNCNPVQGEEPD